MKPRSSMDNIMGGITRCWFADPVDSGGGSAGAVVAGSPLGALSANGGMPASPDAGAGLPRQITASTPDPWISKIFDGDGKLKPGWKDHVKEEVGDSKALDSISDVRALIKRTVNAEKLVGKKAMPKDDASDEEWNEFFKATGIPTKPEDYDIEVGGIDDPGFKEFLDNTHYVDRLLNAFCKGQVPTRVAPHVLNGMLELAEAEWKAEQASEAEVRTKWVEPNLGKTKWDEAGKLGREAMAKLYDHTDATPSENFKAAMSWLENSGAIRHPFITDLLFRLHSRINPTRVFSGGAGTGTGGKVRMTGPGVSPAPDILSVFAPATAAAIRGGA